MQESKAKDTFFSMNRSLNCRGKLLNLASPKVMGILNITPDSFHDGGKFTDPEEALGQVRKMIDEGVDLIDIGAASSRPGAQLFDAEEEKNRLAPVISLLRSEYPELIISLDTYNSSVAKEMVENYEIDIINDISAGSLDPAMLDTIAELNVPYIIMHMKGVPGDMQLNPEYENVTDEIIRFFAEKVHLLHKKGLSDILIDPGFGFGKSLEHNYTLLSQFSSFQMFQLPLVAGISRKSMIYNLLESDSDHALNGTTAAHMLLLQKGANIIRVHDVKEAKEAVRVFNKSNSLKS